jgi:hypothetical protein
MTTEHPTIRGTDMSSSPIISFISVIPFVISIFMGIQQYNKTKQLGAVYFIASCLFFSASITVWGISEVVHDYSIVITFAPFFGSCSAVTIVLHADAISRDVVDPIKLVVISVLATGAMLSDGFEFIIMLQVFSLAVWVYYARKIHVKAPAATKPFSRLYFAGIIVFAVGSLWGAAGFVPGKPSALQMMIDIIRWEPMLGLAFVIIAIAYAKAPNLVNILPFVAIRLSIIDIKAGVALFNHDWARRDDLIHEDLFSSMLSGISMILNESVRKGNIREILLDKARLLLKRSDDYSIAFVLITTRPTKSLRNALEVFSSRFIARYASVLTEQGKDIEISKFHSAIDIVHACFPFAVEYAADEGRGKAPDPPEPLTAV